MTNSKDDFFYDDDPYHTGEAEQETEEHWWLPRSQTDWRMYSKMESNQRRRCLLMEDITALSKMDYRRMRVYIHDNQYRIKSAGFTDRQRNSLAGTVANASGSGMYGSLEDRAFFESLFGTYDPRRFLMEDIRAQHAREDMFKRNMTPDEEIAYYTDCAYGVFRDWVSKESSIIRINEASDQAVQKLRDHLLLDVQYMGQTPTRQEEYTAEDQPIFDNALSLIREARI